MTSSQHEAVAEGVPDRLEPSGTAQQVFGDTCGADKDSRSWRSVAGRLRYEAGIGPGRKPGEPVRRLDHRAHLRRSCNLSRTRSNPSLGVCWNSNHHSVTASVEPGLCELALD